MPRPRRLYNYICYIPSCDRKTKLSLCLRVRPLESGINITPLRNIGICVSAARHVGEPMSSSDMKAISLLFFLQGDDV